MASDGYRDIYESKADAYDELVSHEDHEGNLARVLAELAPGDALSVVEAGAGTGRLTRLLAPRAKRIQAFDGSAAMIAIARRHLADQTHVSLEVSRHDALPVETDGADLALEGWAFGHAVGWNPDGWRDDVRRWVTELDRVTREEGRVILIETMGTGVLGPFEGGHSLEPFDAFVCETLGFERHVVRTDYAFSSIDEAARVLGFFFGERMERRVRDHAWTIVPEHTGVYVRPR
jgi:ubiquinone/menaquinone biosynthesis C-methylase UbiE